MSRRTSLVIGVVVVIVAGLVIARVISRRNQEAARQEREQALAAAREQSSQARDRLVRETLREQLVPVTLSNCEFKRFGEPNDGGYVLCGNLLGSVASGYSYGISNYDKWGCDVSEQLKIPVHEYDCFDTRQPACAANTIFHAECIAGSSFIDEGRRTFDTLANQIARNGDTKRRLVVKMDVEEAEWDSLLHASDETLNQIDQLVIELHGVQNVDYISTIERLKKFFYIVSIHHNNFACQQGLEPFPSWAYEVLFVNKGIGVLDTSREGGRDDAPWTPNNPDMPDCQEWLP